MFNDVKPMDITEAPSDYRYIKQLRIAQGIANQLSEEMPALTPEQTAALTTLVLISDYHQDYVPQADLYSMGKAVMSYEPKIAKGFAKTVSPIEEVYSFAISRLIKLPYVFRHDSETNQYYLQETSY